MKRFAATWGWTVLLTGCYPAQQQVFNPPPPSYRSAVANNAGATGAAPAWQRQDQNPNWPSSGSLAAPSAPPTIAAAAGHRPSPAPPLAGNWRSAGTAAVGASPYQASTASPIRPVAAPMPVHTPRVVQADHKTEPPALRNPVKSLPGSLTMADLVPPPDDKLLPLPEPKPQAKSLATTAAKPTTEPKADAPTGDSFTRMSPVASPSQTVEPPVVPTPIDREDLASRRPAGPPAPATAAATTKPVEVSVLKTGASPTAKPVEAPVPAPVQTVSARGEQSVEDPLATTEKSKPVEAPGVKTTETVCPSSPEVCPSVPASASPTPAVAAPTTPTPPMPLVREHRPAPAVRMVNSKRIQFNYEVKEVGPSGVGEVELWYTIDGQSWHKFETAGQSGPPAVAEVAGEGTYGFTLLAKNGLGNSKLPPRTGDLPQVWVEVDLTPPTVRLGEVKATTDPAKHALQIHWAASDRNLARRPITLSYSDRTDGPWTVIAANLENTGAYTWKLPAGLPARFHVKVEAVDLVGNLGVAQSSEPVLYDASQPSVSILDVAPAVK